MIQGLLVIAVLLILLILRVPVAFSMGLSGVVGLYLANGIEGIEQIGIVSYSAVNNFVLIAVPLFLFLGQYLMKTQGAKDLFAVADVWLRHYPGGLAMATVVASAFFAAISGVSIAAAATIGLVAIPEMLKRGYPRPFALGAVAAGGTLGILIPPSVPMILYGSITGASVGKLFIAGIIPGAILAAMFLIYTSIRGYQLKIYETKSSWSERVKVLKKAFLVILAPLIVLVGIYNGWVTPTESAAIVILYVIAISIFPYRTFSWRGFFESAQETAKTTGMIMMIIVGAKILGHSLALLGIPQSLAAYVSNLGISIIWIVVAAILLWFVMGFFIETSSILLLTIPVLYPVFNALGIDEIWIAILLVITMEMGLITPPVGLNLFVIQGISPKGTQLEEIAKASLPYVFIMFIVVVLVMMWPQLVFLLL